ncbi:trypsin-like peptidase domain-containing protein [Fontivita pretiosa]|uniref:trypsin-like peptidase domain-containing protein n=1 Tax=Fontivita pretiosa TaxID=2989684 RepID=UPI003D186317
MRGQLGLRAAMVVMLALAAQAARAETVSLKDGTVLEGSVIKFGETYRVKTADGQTHTVKASEVRSITKGNATTIRSAAASQGSESGPAAVALASLSASFQYAKSRADAVDAPVLAVVIWEKFIESNPPAAELERARAELDKWRRLQQENAEKINGRWVGGEQRRQLLKEVEQLCREARQMMEAQTLQAVEKYEKALKLYPNNYEANFALGYFYLTRGAVGSSGRGNNTYLDRALRSLETAARLRPDSPETLSNLAIAYNFRQRYVESVQWAYKAAKIQDTRPIVQNLVNSIAHAPRGLQTSNDKLKPIIEEAVILARKHGIGLNGDSWLYLPPGPSVTDSGTHDDKPPGVIGNGSGFVISADGYILTNRHVVSGPDGQDLLFRVRLDDGTEKNAQLVAADPEYDIALLKISASSPLAYLKLAEADLPNPGARCLVLGYPVADVLDFKMQVTSGEISSTNESDEYPLTLSANTTHGNSGGPIVDRDGHVIGMLSAGLRAYDATYVKAVSAGQIRRFLERSRDKHQTSFEPGPATDRAFDAERLAKQARQATLLIFIIRGDGRTDG